MVMVMIRCYKCCEYKSFNGTSKTSEDKGTGIFRQMYIIEDHLYCLDCCKLCKNCTVYILKSHNRTYCKSCELVVKINSINNTSNDITNKLPPELVYMIFSYTRDTVSTECYIGS